MFLEVKDTSGYRCLVNTNQITSILEADNNTTLIILFIVILWLHPRYTIKLLM